MMDLKRRALIVSVVAGLGVALVGAPAYANTVNGGAVTCAVNHQVRISTQTTSGNTVHRWTTPAHTTIVRNYPSGLAHTTLTGSQSVLGWSVTSTGTFTKAVADCF